MENIISEYSKLTQEEYKIRYGYEQPNTKNCANGLVSIWQKFHDRKNKNFPNFDSQTNHSIQ